MYKEMYFELPVKLLVGYYGGLCLTFRYICICKGYNSKKIVSFLPERVKLYRFVINCIESVINNEIQT